jgi:hypothetical protein
MNLSTRLLWLVLGALLVASAAAAGVNRWTTDGPGTATYWLSLDPDGEFVFAAGLRDVFRSGDRGRSWTSSRPPDTFTYPCPAANIVGVDAMRTPGGTAVYVRTYRASEFPGCPPSSRALWKSLDAGSSWIATFFQAESLAVDTNGQTVAYQTETGYICFPPRPVCSPGPLVQWMYGTEDGGATWDVRYGLNSQGLIPLAVDPEDPRIVYGIELNRLVRSGDGARTWLDAYLGATPENIWTTPGAVFVTSGANLLHRSTDGGATWEQTATTPPASITSLVADPHRPGLLWAGTAGHGIFRSADNGDTWVPDNEGIETLAVYDLAFDPSGRILYAATYQGVFSRETRAPRVVAPRP